MYRRGLVPDRREGWGGIEVDLKSFVVVGSKSKCRGNVIGDMEGKMTLTGIKSSVERHKVIDVT